MTINRTITFLFSLVIISCNNRADSTKSTRQAPVSSVAVKNDSLREIPQAPAPKPEAPKPKIHAKTTAKKAILSSVSKDTVQSLIDYRPPAELNAIRLFNSLAAESDSSLFNESVTRLRNFFSDGLKLQINEWEGTVLSVTVLEHAAMEIEISCPLYVNLSDAPPKPRFILFLSHVSTFNRDMVAQLEDLLEGDRVIFSGTVVVYSNGPAIQPYTDLKTDVFKHPQIILEMSDVRRILE